MTTSIEDTLRDMLRERAGDIATVPTRLTHLARDADFEPDEEVLDARPTRHSAWLLAAAVALIVAVAGAIIGIRQLGSRDTRPAAPNSTSSPSTRTASPRPSRTQDALPAAALVCTASLPAAWQAALASPPSAEGAQSATPLQVLPNGDVLVARDFGQGRPRDLAIISPGKAPRSIFSVPDPQELNVQNAQITGHWLIVGVGAHPRPQKHTIPGDSPMPNVVHLYVIDLRTGDHKQIASTTLLDGSSGGRTINLATVLDGKVYWDVRVRYGSPTGVIRSYDPVTGETRTVYSGEMGYLVSSAAGIGTGSAGQVYVRASLPSIVAANLSRRYPLTVATDGTSFAWEIAPRELAWWRPGLSKPHYLRLRQPAGLGSIVVSGQYVMTVDGGAVIDVQTSAAASYSGSPQNAPASRLLSFGTTARGQWVAALDLDGEEHWQNGYWVERPTQVARFGTTSLPDLHC
jgi:hypothetical protein